MAHGGIDAKIGAKNTETKKASPVTMAVIPVLPPSNQRHEYSVSCAPYITRVCYDHVPLIPVALSTNEVTGLVPISAPMLIQNASTQYAIVEFSKSNVTGSRRPANFAIEYSVLVI